MIYNILNLFIPPFIIGIFILIVYNMININIKSYIRMISNSKLDYLSVSKEFTIFALSIITHRILEALILSEKDSSGGRIAIQQISDPTEPVYVGIIVSVVGSMSNEMKDKFYIFFNRDDEDNILMNEITKLLDSYNLILQRRLNKIEEDIKNANKVAVKNQKEPLDFADTAYQLLIESVVDDINIFRASK